jgi:hypothetical protein
LARWRLKSVKNFTHRSPFWGRDELRHPFEKDVVDAPIEDAAEGRVASQEDAILVQNSHAHGRLFEGS